MKRTEVESSNIKAVGYEAGTLEIEFLNGNVYRYLKVPPEIHDGLMGSGSKGKYAHANIYKAFEQEKVK